MKKQLFLLLIAFLFFSTSVLANEKETVLRKCETLFGKTIDEKLNLFEIDKDFVLQIKFDETGNLINLDIGPKYKYNDDHPEWVEPASWPLLTSAQYKDLRSKMEEIKSVGDMVSRPAIFVVTNSTRWVPEYYEKGFIESGQYGNEGIRNFTVNFFHKITGMVKKLKASNSQKYISGLEANNKVHQVRVIQDEEVRARIYFVTKKVYKSLKKGKVQTFEAALVN